MHLKERVVVDILSYIIQIIVLPPSTDAFLRVSGLREAIFNEGSHVPKNRGLYWFMPALAKSNVGSSCGMQVIPLKVLNEG